MVGRGTTSKTTMQKANQARGTSLDLERVCYVIQSKPVAPNQMQMYRPKGLTITYYL